MLSGWEAKCIINELELTYSWQRERIRQKIETLIES